MTRADLLHCITDRPCAVCRFNEDGNGCKKWNCMFEEKPENDTLDLDAWNDMIDELIEFEEKCNKENPDAVMWVHNAIGIVAKYDRLVKHSDDQMEHFNRLGEYYNGILERKGVFDDFTEEEIRAFSNSFARALDPEWQEAHAKFGFYSPMYELEKALGEVGESE